MSKQLSPSHKVAILKEGIAQIKEGASPVETWVALARKHGVSRSSLYGWLKAVRERPVQDWEAILLPDFGKRRGQYKEVSQEAYDHFKEQCDSGIPWSRAHRITSALAAERGWEFPGIHSVSKRLRDEGMKPPSIYDDLEL